MRKPITPLLLIFSILLMCLSSCNLGNNDTYTDPNAVYTSAAQTVAVQLTANAAQFPSSTPSAPSESISTPIIPTLTNTIPVQPTTSLNQSTSTPIPSPTITFAPVNDRAELVSQNPVDGSLFSANQAFTTTWTIKNSGLTTWTTNFQIRFFSGDRLGSSAPSYPLGSEVKPGETIKISIPMIAPSQPGEYTSTWVLTNQNLLNFYPVFVTIKVTSATLTPTPTMTTTATPTPSQTTEGSTP